MIKGVEPTSIGLEVGKIECNVRTTEKPNLTQEMILPLDQTASFDVRDEQKPNVALAEEAIEVGGLNTLAKKNTPYICRKVLINCMGCKMIHYEDPFVNFFIQKILVH